MSARAPEQPRNEKSEQDLSLLQLYLHAILRVLEAGVLLVDNEDRVVIENEALGRLWRLDTPLLGRKLGESPLAHQCPELLRMVAQVRARKSFAQMEFPAGDRHLSLTLKPVTEAGQQDIIGILIYFADVSPQQHLQRTLEELQTTAEDLQSANEQLATTNEELKSLHQELEDINQELARRSALLDPRAGGRRKTAAKGKSSAEGKKKAPQIKKVERKK